MNIRRLGSLLLLCGAAVALGGEMTFQQHAALMDSLRYLPPNMRFYEMDRLGVMPRSPAPVLSESAGLHLAGKWGAGPSVKVTGRDSLVFLSRGSEVVAVNFADTADPRVLSYMQVNGLVSRSVLVGNRLYVGSTGSDPKYVDVFDVTNPDDPQRLGQIQTRLLDIDVVDTLVYTVAKDSFRVFDFSDPANPRQLGACRDSGYTLSACNGYAYIADRWGLYVVDARDPTNPHHVASWGTRAISVKARGNICCATLADINDDLTFYVLDVREPASIAPLGSLDNQGGYDIFLEDSLAFLSGLYIGSGYEFKILSIGDSTRPALIGQASTWGDNNGVWASSTGHRAFVADRAEGLQVFDISTLPVPAHDTTVLAAGSSHDVAVCGNLAAVANEICGMKLLGIADPERPVEVGSVDTFFQSPATHAVVLSDSFAYMGFDRQPYQRTVWVGDSTHPQVVGGCAEVQTLPEAMVLRDTLLFIAGRLRFQIINVARPREPVLVGSCVLSGYSGDLALVDTIAYLSGPVLSIVNVAKPDSPRVVSTWSRGVSGLDVVDTILYAVGQNAQFWAVSVADPTSPRCLDSLHLPSYDGEDVAVIGSTAFISENVIRIIDVSNPGNLQLIGQASVPYWTPRLQYQAPYLYACCAEGGICILETVPTGIAESRPARPEGRQLAVSPSVTSGWLTMDVPAVTGSSELTVYNVAGKEVLRLQAPAQRNDLTERWPVDLSRLSAGVYVLRLDGKGVSQTGKVVLTRR